MKDIPYDGVLADIWSSGVVLYAMIYGNFPFKADTVEELEALIIDGNYSLPNEISKEARQLLAHIMSLDPNSRPSIDEILADPWMKDVNENSILLIL